MGGNEQKTNEILALGGFTGFPKNYVRREHLTKTIDDLFGGGNDVVYLEGRPGIGLTSIAAEYAGQSGACVLSLFIRGGSRLSYAPFRLAGDLIAQVDLQLGAAVSVAHSDVIGAWHTRFSQLRELLRPHGRNILFVVDGLHQIPAEDARFSTEIYKDLLAVGVPGIRHLITLGERQAFTTDSATRTRAYRISRLSSGEVQEIIATAGVPPDKFKEYYSYTDGIPALVQSACRLFARGQPLDGLATELPSFYEAEWAQFEGMPNADGRKLKKVLAFLAFGKGALSLNELGAVSELDSEAILLLARTEVFVRCSSDQRTIEFLSHGHREFVVTKLATMRDEVMAKMIDRLIADPTSEASLALLPTFFDEANRLDELVQYLSPENLGKYLDYSRSVTALRRRTELGLRRAMSDARYVHAYQFALQTSLIRAMDAPRIPADQMGALAALGEIEVALSQAQQARTTEERLYLLSVLARQLKAGGLAIPAAVEDEIRALVERAGVGNSSRWGFAVAANLVGAFPDIGFGLVESSAYEDSTAKESAIARLALNELIKAKREDSTAGSVLSRVKNQDMRSFLAAVQTAILTQSPSELESSTKKLPTKIRTQVFCQWALINRRRDGAYRIIEIALDEYVRDASYLPTASNLWELCTTLVSCADYPTVEAIAKRVEGFKGSISQAGSTIDLIRLDLELAVALALCSTVASSLRFEEVYLQVCYLDDHALRLEGFALLLEALHRTASKVHLSAASELRSDVEKELPSTIDVLLKDTADHELVFEQTLPVLLDLEPSRAIQLVGRFNTSERRNAGFAALAEKYAQGGRDAVDISSLDSMVAAITDRGVADQTVVNVLRAGRASKRLVGARAWVEQRVKSIHHPVLRCEAISLAVGIDFAPGDRVDQWLQEIGHALTQFDRASSRPREAYRFVQAVATQDKAEGSRVYRSIQALLSNYSANSEAALTVSYLCARAAVVSFGALIAREAFSQQDLGRLIAAIETVTSSAMQAELMSDLALRALEKKNASIFEEVCAKHLYPLVTHFGNEQEHTKNLCLLEAFPCLFVWNQALGLELVKDLDPDLREEAAANAIDYLTTQVPPGEPFQGIRGSQFSLDYPRARLSVDLLALIETDSLLSSRVESICRVLNHKASRNQISSVQRSSLVQEMRTMVAKKLPDKRNIQHQGWQIYCQAYFSVASDAPAADWEQLIAEAGRVPNASDRVYVLAELSKAMPDKYVLLKKDALARAVETLPQIPAYADGIVRRIGLSDIAAGFERTSAERFLREALEHSMRLKDEDTALSIQKRIIDTAQQFDKSLAEKLAEKLDDDPARLRAKSELQNAAKSIRRRDGVSNGDYTTIKGVRAESLNRACYDALASLNSGRLAAPKLDMLAPIVSHASHFPLSEVYWAYAWLLRGCQQRMESSADALRVLQPTFEVTLLSCELVQRLAGSSDAESIFRDRDAGSIVGPSDRLDAITHIRDWFRSSESEEVLICDPYFTLSDLELIKVLHFERQSARFVVLSCKGGNASRDISTSLEEAWNSICDQPPPEIRLVVVAYDGEGRSGPIHDRWILAGTAGLRVGTSFNSLGLSKLSEISSVEAAQVANLTAALKRFVAQQERAIDGRRLRYFVEQV